MRMPLSAQSTRLILFAPPRLSTQPIASLRSLPEPPGVAYHSTRMSTACPTYVWHFQHGRAEESMRQMPVPTDFASIADAKISLG